MTLTQLVPESDLPSIVARRVRGLLGEYQMKQAELALRLGLSTTAMSHRLAGNKDFDLIELPGLAAALDVSMEYLLGFTDDRRPHRAPLDEASDELRARRDSNPKPSDPEPRGGLLIDLGAWRENRTRGAAVANLRGQEQVS